MSSVIGISTGGISDLFIQQQMLLEIDSAQSAMTQTEEQLSSGYAFQTPSQNPTAAMQTMGLQQQLLQLQQLQTNVGMSQSYLTAADSALQTVTTALNSAQSVALGAVGSTATASQRAAAAQQVQAAIQELIQTANTQFDGRYLFGGSNITTAPFQSADGGVVYNGNDQSLNSYTALDTFTPSNATGAAIFGGLSAPVGGGATLSPAITATTLLSNLDGGQGIVPGAIMVNGTTIDLSKAATIGDVGRLIQLNPTVGSQVDVAVTPTGLGITPAAGAGTLDIQNVGGDSTATDLGIATSGSAAPPLDPVVTNATPLADLLGTRASAVVRSGAVDGNVLISATGNGSQYNNIAINYAGDGTSGQEYATFTPSGTGGGDITVHIQPGETTAANVIAAVNQDLGSYGIQAQLDPTADTTGRGIVDVTATATTSGGSGQNLDQSSGIQITNGGNTYTVSFQNAKTVGDVVNAINNSSAGMLASINAAGTGIQLQSRISGSAFTVAENGGATAAELGLGTFTSSTQLSQLNDGAGLSQDTTPTVPATASFNFSAANTNLLFTAASGTSGMNGYTIQFIGGATPGNESVSLAGKTITIQIAQGVTTAAQVVALFNDNSSVSGLFNAALDTSTDPSNDGSGAINSLPTATTAGEVDGGTEFTISANGGTLSINVQGCQTIGDVVQLINSQAASQGMTLQAALNTSGNGIELYDAGTTATSPSTITVSTANESLVANELGLIPSGADTSTSEWVTQTTTNFADPNANVAIQATSADTNPAAPKPTVQFVATGSGPASCVYDTSNPSNPTLTFYFIPGVTTGNDIVQLLHQSSAASEFSAQVTGSGDGLVTACARPMTDEAMLQGSDVNPQENSGVFTALSLLQNGLTTNNSAETQRAMSMLGTAITQVSFSQAEIGVQQQNLTALQTQQSNQNLQLQQSLSNVYDTDFASAASTFTAEQLAYQATLQTSASIMKMSLLNYL